MRGKKYDNYDNKVPGPGAYKRNTETNLKDSAPSWR